MRAPPLFGGAQLAGLFTADPLVIAEAHAYLKAYAIDCLLTAVLFEIGLGTPISSAVQILLCIAACRWYQSRAERSAG